MAHVIRVYRAIHPQNFNRHAAHRAGQDFIHVIASEVALIQTHIKAVGIVCIIAAGTQNNLTALGRVAVVITQMLGPGAKGFCIVRHIS